MLHVRLNKFPVELFAGEGVPNVGGLFIEVVEQLILKFWTTEAGQLNVYDVPTSIFFRTTPAFVQRLTVVYSLSSTSTGLQDIVMLVGVSPSSGSHLIERFQTFSVSGY
jgi:hypothetical protein